jgi:hypothetical protein
MCRPDTNGTVVFLDLKGPGCVFGCGLSLEAMGMSLMLAKPLVWVVILHGFLYNGNQRRHQVHDVPEMKPALLGVPVESQGLSASTDTTGAFDVSGPEKRGLFLRIRVEFQGSGDIIDAFDTLRIDGHLAWLYIQRRSRRCRVHEVPAVI